MDEGKEKTQGKHCQVRKWARAAQPSRDNVGVQRGTHIVEVLQGIGEELHTEG